MKKGNIEFDSELYDLLKETFKGTGNWTTQSNLDMYNEGVYWDTLEEFLNDKDLIFSEQYMINAYYHVVVEDENYLEVEGNYELLNLLVTDLLENEHYYLTCEEIENSYSYNEEL